MNSIQRRAALLLVATLATGSALAQSAAPVRVGSKIDTEGKLLGNMIVLVLEANGIKTEKDVATANKLKTLDDLGKWLASNPSGGQFKLAASAEFVERSDALPAFQTAYSFKLKPEQILTLAGGDTAVTIKAAAEKTSGVNAAMAYGTDGAVAALGLVILDDPKGVQPIYAPAPIIREEALKKNPKIATVLAPVFKLLDGPTLQGLNAKIQLEGQDAKKVAGDFLKSKGLLK